MNQYVSELFYSVFCQVPRNISI